MAFGMVITLPLSGIIAEYSWEGVFYLSGVLGTVWFVAWYFLCYSTPLEHPRISKASP